MKGEYTEAVHAKRLISMFKLQNEETGFGCPAKPNFEDVLGKSPRECWAESKVDPCDICLAFVNIKLKPDELTCPCNYYWREEITEITNNALKEKGYLKGVHK